ncbi:MAG: hypothetical protein HYT61_01980 [Candidatus Yanofskybacteria bacterium]|nr:hypothetical protein [Candidatus Yanofskybacteria bacterium]
MLEKINEILIGEKGTYSLPEWSREEIRALINSKKLDVKVYLGDGGLSRLLLIRLKNKIIFEISIASSGEVKERWKKLFGPSH